MATFRLAAILVVATISGCSKPSTSASDMTPVKAIMYPMCVVEDPIRNRRGHWINELYLPDPGVVANVEWNLDPGLKPGANLEFLAISNAFFGTLEERRQGTLDVRPNYTWTQEEVDLPPDLAKQIVALAEITRTREAARRDVASALSARLGLDSGGGRHPLPKNE